MNLPDSESTCIGGWQGRVIGIEKLKKGKTLIDIEWDSITLKSMPLDYIKESELEGLDHARMFLYIDEVELTRAVDSGVPLDMAKAEKLLDKALANADLRYDDRDVIEDRRELLEKAKNSQTRYSYNQPSGP